jgi:hypothetical protein
MGIPEARGPRLDLTQASSVAGNRRARRKHGRSRRRHRHRCRRGGWRCSLLLLSLDDVGVGQLGLGPDHQRRRRWHCRIRRRGRCRRGRRRPCGPHARVSRHGRGRRPHRRGLGLGRRHRRRRCSSRGCSRVALDLAGAPEGHPGPDRAVSLGGATMRRRTLGDAPVIVGPRGKVLGSGGTPPLVRHSTCRVRRARTHLVVGTCVRRRHARVAHVHRRCCRRGWR